MGSANSEGGSYWAPPARVTSAQIEDARLYANAVMLERPPASREFVAERCASLLLHFFTAASGEKLNAMVAADWLAILSPFPPRVLAAAVQRWLETETGKPKPAQIRDLCITFYGRKDWENLERAKIIAMMQPSAEADPEKKGTEWQKPTPEQKAKVAEMVANMQKTMKEKIQ